MDAPNKETIRKKTTSIPRLNRKISCDSPLTNEFREDNSVLNRCSSDPNQHMHRTPDQNAKYIITKTKKLCKFTINEKLNNDRNDEMAMSGNNDVDDNINSCAINGEDHNKHITHEAQKEAYEKGTPIDDSVVERNNEHVNYLTTCSNAEAVNNASIAADNYSNQSEINGSEISMTNPCPEIVVSSYQPSVPPLQLQHIQTQVNEDTLLRNQSPKQPLSLQEAYLKQLGQEANRHQFDQCKWNVINPMYKNIPLRRNLHKNIILNPSLISDIDVKKLTQKEESSDIESDDEAIFKTAKSCRREKSNSTLSNFFNNLASNKENTPSVTRTNKKSGESLVDAFMEVFGDDSHIVQKLQNNRTIKYDDRFRKLKSKCCNRNSKQKEVCVIQESPKDSFNYASRKLKLVHDLYKNDDVYSSITASSNDRSIPEHLSSDCSPRQVSKQCKSISSNTVRGCGCEIKHLQLNDVQKSIEDIHSVMKIMLDNFSSTTTEDIAVELIKLRSSYDECLTYQKKIAMQNKRLQNDIHNMCATLFQILERKQTVSKVKYLVLPILGVIVYFVVNHFDVCNKFPVSFDE